MEYRHHYCRNGKDCDGAIYSEKVTVHGLDFDESHPVESAPSFALSVRSDGYAAWSGVEAFDRGRAKSVPRAWPGHPG
jgi:hypothetical protein